MLRSCPPSFADGESRVRIREQQGRGEAKDVSRAATFSHDGLLDRNASVTAAHRSAVWSSRVIFPRWARAAIRDRRASPRPCACWSGRRRFHPDGKEGCGDISALSCSRPSPSRDASTTALCMRATLFVRMDEPKRCVRRKVPAQTICRFRSQAVTDVNQSRAAVFTDTPYNSERNAFHATTSAIRPCPCRTRRHRFCPTAARSAIRQHSARGGRSCVTAASATEPVCL